MKINNNKNNNYFKKNNKCKDTINYFFQKTCLINTLKDKE